MTDVLNYVSANGTLNDVTTFRSSLSAEATDSQLSNSAVSSSLEVMSGPPGLEGPEGPQGLPGGFALVWPQSSASASWVIPHTAGRFVSVTLLNDSGVEVFADVSQIVDQVSVSYPSPVTGTALLV